MSRRRTYGKSNISYKEGKFLGNDNKLYLPSEVTSTNRSSIVGYCLAEGKIMSIACQYGSNLRYSTINENTPSAPISSLSDVKAYKNGYGIFESIINNSSFAIAKYPQHKWCYELGMFMGKQWYLPSTGELYPLFSSKDGQSWGSSNSSGNSKFGEIRDSFVTAGFSNGWVTASDWNIGFFTTVQASNTKMWLIVPNFGFRDDLPKTSNPHSDRFATIAFLDINS